MIRKIFAQDLSATWKSLSSTVGILMLVATVSLVISVLEVPVLGGIGLGVAIIAMIALTPIVLGILAENYWRTMYGREGYFTMVVPATGRALFSAKVLYGIAASLAAVVLTALGLFACAAVFAQSVGQDVFEFLRLGLEQLGASMTWFFVGCVVLQLVYLVIVGAGIMSVGARARFNHLGFGAPVIGAVLMYVAVTVVGFAAMLFVPLGARLTGPDAGSFVAEGMFRTFVDEVAGGTSGEAPEVFGLGILFVSVAASCLFAWWGARSVQRHTSLR
ncbi:MAG: hypothetical protein ACTMIH_03005 [Microbacterium gubbeenense]|uniref:hypothetical protein n=1 Tax=Microbacterium gubbeenense TaxID=159896 RepID=UPI003F981D46